VIAEKVKSANISTGRQKLQTSWKEATGGAPSVGVSDISEKNYRMPINWH